MKTDLLTNRTCCGCGKKKKKAVSFETEGNPPQVLCRQCLIYLASRLQGEAVRFPDFWRTYPDSRLTNRAGCLKLWQSQHLDTVADLIINDLKCRAAGWADTEPKFIPLPYTYLNQHRWEDGQTIPQAKTGSTWI